MKKNRKILLAVAAAVLILAFAYFGTGNDEPITPVVTDSTVSVGEKKEIKIKETYKPAGGDTENDSVQPSEGQDEKNTATLNPKNVTEEAEAIAPSEKKATESNKKTKNEEKKNTCTLSISCVDAIGKIPEEKIGLIPQDGIILPASDVEVKDGDSVFDILLRETKARKIHMEFSQTPTYNSIYIEGISNIYEFDCGPLSGWTYIVNGEFPSMGCSEVKVSKNDKIEFVYTCNLGGFSAE